MLAGELDHGRPGGDPTPGSPHNAVCQSGSVMALASNDPARLDRVTRVVDDRPSPKMQGTDAVPLPNARMEHPWAIRRRRAVDRRVGDPVARILPSRDLHVRVSVDAAQEQASALSSSSAEQAGEYLASG